jgi:hypothetical protein
LDQERLRWRARAIVAAIALAFLLQIGYVFSAEEPYPAIMMPRFGWAGPTKAGTIEISVPEIVMRYADSTTKVLTAQQLLSRLQDGHHSVIMENLLSPLPSPLPTRHAPPGRYEPPGWLFPGYNLARISRGNVEHINALKEWLRGRAHDFYPGSPPVMCTVNWYTETYPYDVRIRPTARHQPPNRFEIDLSAEPAHLR